MTRASIAGGLLGLALLCGAGGVLAAPGEVGGDPYTRGATIILVDGEVIENAQFEVNERYKVVTVLLDDGQRHISFNEIESIIVDGEGVTAEVLGGSRGGAPGQAGTSPSKTSTAYRKGGTSLFKTALGLHSCYSLPLTDYYAGIEGDLGFGGDLLIGLKRDLALRLTVSRSGLKTEYSRFTVTDPYYETVAEFDEFDFSATRFVLGVQYQKHLKPKESISSLVYAVTGIGFVYQDSHAEGYLYDLYDDGPGSPFVSDYSETKFLTNLGMGVVLPVGKRVGIDLLANLDMLWLGSTSADFYYATQHAFILDLRVGVLWFIP